MLIRKHITRPCGNIYFASRAARLPSLPCVRNLTKEVICTTPNAPRRFYSTTFMYKSPQENQKVVSAYIQSHLPKEDVAMINYLDNIFNCALLLHNAEKQVPFSHVVAMLQQCTELFPVAHEQLPREEEARKQAFLQALQLINHQATIFEKEKSTHVGLVVKAVSTQYCGDFSTAYDLFKLLSEEAQKTHEPKFQIYAYSAMAAIEFSQQKHDEAMQTIERAIQLDTQNGYAYQLKGVFLANQGRLDEAVSVISHAISVEPNNSALYSLRGFMKTSLGKAQEALHDLQTAVRMQPNISEPRLPLALHYILQFNDITSGLVELETSLIIAAQDTQLIWSTVQQFLEQIKQHPRSEIIQFIVQGMLGTRIAEVQKAQIPPEKRTEFIKQNLQNYDDAVAKEPQAPEPYFFRALAKSEMKMTKEAVEDLGKAISLNPEYYQAYSYRATLAIQDNLSNENALREKLNEMQTDFEKARSINPDYYDIYWNRSTLYVLLRKGEEALADVNKAIELRPRYSSTQYYKRAHVNMLLDKREQALADYTTAIEIHPDAPHLYKERAQLLRQLGKEDLAKQDEAVFQQMQNAMQQYFMQQQQMQQQQMQMQQKQQQAAAGSTSSAPSEQEKQ